jgi:hypothetical protein
MRNTVVATLVGIACAGCGSVDNGDDDGGRQVQCVGGTANVLENGNFDAAEPAWLQDPPGLLCGAPQITPDTGATAACMGGVDGTVQTVSHEVFLPAGASSARLTGRICIATQETEATDLDVLTFDLVDGVASIGALGERSNQQGVANCQFATFMLETQLDADPVSATLRLRTTLDPNRPTSFFVDSLALTVACE